MGRDKEPTNWAAFPSCPRPESPSGKPGPIRINQTDIHVTLDRRSSRESAAAFDPAGGRLPLLRRSRGVSHRFELRPWLPYRRQGRHGTHPSSTPARRQAQLHAGVPRPFRDRQLCGSRQRVLPAALQLHAGTVYLHIAGDARGAAALAAPEAQDHRHTRARQRDRAGDHRHARRALAEPDADAAGRRDGADRPARDAGTLEQARRSRRRWRLLRLRAHHRRRSHARHAASRACREGRCRLPAHGCRLSRVHLAFTNRVYFADAGTQRCAAIGGVGAACALAITVHEVAHGWVARHLGDPTAMMLGRLTLNPLKHIDLVGTVLVPIALILLGGVIFGWAKPVPITVENLKHPKRDMAYVAVAGPLSNLLMALLWALVMKLALLASSVAPGLAMPLTYMGAAGITINTILMVLTLLPVPPLDGSRVVAGLLPDPMAWKFNRLEPYGLIILLALMVSGILGRVLEPGVVMIQNGIYHLLSL